MRTYAGHSDAKRSNELYRRNLEKGQTGLSVAFDLPTQTGYDPDHELANGEVGKVGVSIAHVGDMRTLLDGMIARRRGRIVSISSDAARVGSTGEAVYAACKAGVIGFSKALAREVARHRITVNVVCPGPTETALLAATMAGERGVKILEGMRRAIPLGRLGQPEDVAGAVAYLVSDEASYVTGQVLSVSGGLTMAG